MNIDILTDISKRLNSFEDQYNFRCTCKDFKTAIDRNITTCDIDLSNTINTLNYPKNIPMKNFKLSSYNRYGNANKLMGCLYKWKKEIKNVHIELPYMRIFPKLFKGFHDLSDITLYLKNKNTYKILRYLPDKLNVMSLFVSFDKEFKMNYKPLTNMNCLETLIISSHENSINLSVLLRFLNCKNVKHIHIDSVLIYNIKNLYKFESLETLHMVNVSSFDFNRTNMTSLKNLNLITVLFSEENNIEDSLVKLINMNVNDIVLVNTSTIKFSKSCRSIIRNLTISYGQLDRSFFEGYCTNSDTVIKILTCFTNPESLMMMRNIQFKLDIVTLEICDSFIREDILTLLKYIFECKNISIERIIFKNYLTYGITLTIINIPDWYSV